VAALQKVDDKIGQSTLALLQSPQSLSHEVMLTSLLNDVDNRSDLLILVLDDYHLINTPAIHRALLFLLDHLPPQLHIVLSSRADPPLTLARWRGQGKLIELRIDDLRFSDDEAAGFLRQVMGLNLSAQAIAALESRTEGWVAGLQLAALSPRLSRRRGTQPTIRRDPILSAANVNFGAIVRTIVRCCGWSRAKWRIDNKPDNSRRVGASQSLSHSIGRRTDLVPLSPPF
jgi:ATP/maltotriose-dependent transcriptional regulator MalT